MESFDWEPESYYSKTSSTFWPFTFLTSCFLSSFHKTSCPFNQLPCHDKVRKGRGIVLMSCCLQRTLKVLTGTCYTNTGYYIQAERQGEVDSKNPGAAEGWEKVRQPGNDRQLPRTWVQNSGRLKFSIISVIFFRLWWREAKSFWQFVKMKGFIANKSLARRFVGGM